MMNMQPLHVPSVHKHCETIHSRGLKTQPFHMMILLDLKTTRSFDRFNDENVTEKTLNTKNTLSISLP